MARKSLADELQNLINPEPSFADPEDDENFDTSKNWIDSTDRAHDAEVSGMSKLRKKQVSLLSTVNKKYSGKKISRKQLLAESEDEDNEEEDEEDGDEDADEDQDQEMEDLDGEESEIGDEEDDEEDEEDEEAEYDEDEDEELDDESIGEGVQNGMKSLKIQQTQDDDDDDDGLNILRLDTDKQIEKANAVKSQLMMYDSLLETRIKMQKVLQNCNRLPQMQNMTRLSRKKNPLLEGLLIEAHKGVRKLGKVLLEIDNYVDLKLEGHDDSSSTTSPGKRKVSPNYDNDSLAKRFAGLSSKYGAIIDNWHERTRFVNANVKLKKFDSFEIAPTKAIEQILSDRSRLIARTRHRRSQFDIIGQPKRDVEQLVEGDEFDEEIFDDEDFYHQLLKQIIENKMGDLDETSSAARKFVEIQRMRNKLKKTVDTRASKGRKIRYNVHEKLVNFMAPIDRTTIEDDAKNKLFRSLFGNFQSAAPNDD